MTNDIYSLGSYGNKVEKLHGPIIVFGAGGFIGLNLLKSLLLYRDDVYGISQDPVNNWRFMAAQVPRENLKACDIREMPLLLQLFEELKPRTIFNLAAYGAYSKQNEYKKIYDTNFTAHVDIIEAIKQFGFGSYIYAGSSSEYGLNCAAPAESDELIPNSHYAVSKVAAYYALKYYGKVEHLPVAHLRLYSAYGPWEEPDRLVPVLLSKVRKGEYPPLVDPDITRDFIYITDISTSFVEVALQLQSKKQFGESFNIGTGKRTSIKELAVLAGKLEQVKEKPSFGSMPNRSWDLSDWYANIEKTSRETNWKATIPLRDGLEKTLAWQKQIKYDDAFWNWTKSV